MEEIKEIGEIESILYKIRDNIDVPAYMYEILEIMGLKKQGFDNEEYRAILIKMIIDKFDHSIYSDYLLAVFGLQLGYGDETQLLTWRRKKHIYERSIALGIEDYKSINDIDRNTPNNYSREKIHEGDTMHALAEFISQIDDMVKYCMDFDEYMTVIDGRMVANPPLPSYAVSAELANQRVATPKYVTAQAVVGLMRRFFSSEEARTLYIQNFKKDVFVLTLSRMREDNQLSEREYHGWLNFLSVVEKATRTLSDSTEEINIEEPFDFDWFVRFFDAVANISNEDMQKLWGKVLAGEIKKQGAFSLRTVEALRNMTRRDISALMQSYKYALTAVTFSAKTNRIHHADAKIPFFDSEPVITSEYISDGVNDSDIYLEIETVGYINEILQDADIIGYHDVECRYDLRQSDLCFIIGQRALVIRHINDRGRGSELYFKHKVFHYRQTGRELLSVANVEPDEDEIISLGRLWKDSIEDPDEIPQVEICAFKVKNFDPDCGEIILEGEDLLK